MYNKLETPLRTESLQNTCRDLSTNFMKVLRMFINQCSLCCPVAWIFPA